MSAKTDASVAKDSNHVSDGPGSGTTDAATICNPTGAFDAPVAVTSLNTNGDDGAPRFTADELEAVFYREAPASNNSELYIADRTSVSAPLGTGTAITQANSTSNEYNPTISSDGLTMFFESTRSGIHIYVSTRTSTLASFGTASLAAGINSNTTTDADAQPFLTADSQELWFSSTRMAGDGYDLYRAVKSGNAFGTVTSVAALNTTSNDMGPVLSADKLTIYFTSDRGGGPGGLDIWTSHRSTVTDGFPAPTLVTELNSASDDVPGWLSADNCRLYFASKRTTGNYDVYVATRHP